MLLTTYQHDYIPPYERRYAHLRKNKTPDGEREREVCQCIDEQKVETPKAVTDQCAAVEWTGIAPMGKLIEPRIIPTKLSPEQLEGMLGDATGDCLKEQPNRFLRILRTAYPDLYERLKAMPKDELNRRVERQRLYTTYQIDFCDVNEYPEGIYDSLKTEKKADRDVAKLLEPLSPCAEFRRNVMQEMSLTGDEDVTTQDPCAKLYKPFRISFTDSSRFITGGNNSHWRSNMFTKRANFSEYMDTINKSGCIIMKNKIHNHSKCISGKHCKHPLIHACTNLK